VHLADVLVDVPDFTAPTQAQLHQGLLETLRLMEAAPGLPVYVGCAAGLGRTGTFIAALARLAGIEGAVAWTRAHYDPRAVETPAQEAAVAALDPAAVWAAYGAGS
jgi:protein-tyrosine phosphatase